MGCSYCSTATIEVERRWHRWVERDTAWMESGHIVNSAALAEHVVRAFGVSRERVHVVPPSLGVLPILTDKVQARAALGLAADEYVVAWVGRFDPVKRLDLIVRCAEQMMNVPTRFLLVGDGPDRIRIERLLRDSPAASRVQLLGWREDVVSVLCAADAFLFPSLTEGMPNAVLEAMACGLPIVGSDIPALRELAGVSESHQPSAVGRQLLASGPRAGRTESPGTWPEPPPGHERCTTAERMLIVPGDRPEGYVAALLRLRDDPALARTLGEHAAAWARQHLDPQATVEAVLRAYRDVLRSRPPFASKT